MSPYTQINFIPGVKYDLKGKRNRIVLSECIYVCRNELEEFIFRGGKWINEEDNPSFKWYIPNVDITYSIETMREFNVNEYKPYMKEN
jgi:hypothetical protein